MPAAAVSEMDKHPLGVWILVFNFFFSGLSMKLQTTWFKSTSHYQASAELHWCPTRASPHLLIVLSTLSFHLNNNVHFNQCLSTSWQSTSIGHYSHKATGTFNAEVVDFRFYLYFPALSDSELRCRFVPDFSPVRCDPQQQHSSACVHILVTHGVSFTALMTRLFTSGYSRSSILIRLLVWFLCRSISIL